MVEEEVVKFQFLRAEFVLELSNQDLVSVSVSDKLRRLVQLLQHGLDVLDLLYNIFVGQCTKRKRKNGKIINSINKKNTKYEKIKR